MLKKISDDNQGLLTNTSLQKKNDKNIQHFLNKYKHYEENPEYVKNTGEHVNLIISHKSTIPDLVIYNQVFNKNYCFIEANKNENNYFPRQVFYIKFEGDEKDISKGIKNSKNEEIKEKEEENFDDDEEEDEEEFENENNTNKNIIEKQSKINNVSNVDINSIISNNNSMCNDIDNLPNNNNINISLFSTDSTLRHYNNFNDNSMINEDNNYSYSSKVMKNINSYIEPKNDENSFSQQTNYQQKNINFQNLTNIPNTPNNNFNNSYNIGNNNINNNNNTIGNNQSITSNVNNNKIVNMFSNQIELLDLINQKMKNNINGSNDEIINELKEDIIKLTLLGPDGNITNKIMNFEEMLDYITYNILDKNKSLEKYNIYIIDTEEKIKGKEFYFPIINFCGEKIKF